MDPAALTSIRRDRPVYEFELPEELAGTDQYVKKTIGLVKLEMGEEISATERAAGNQARLAYGFLRLSLVEVDGRKINKGEGEDETILEHCDPQVRELMLEAFTAVATTKPGVTKKFLGSMKVRL